MAEEIRRSSCDKGLEKWNYEVEGKKKEERQKEEHDAPRKHCSGSLTMWHTQGDSGRANRLICLERRLTKTHIDINTRLHS